ncbi:MAG TPA: 16S rRNA (cytosine(967)-C(5))-methyltransferase RsmB [Candidatus Sulfotelmatobacter sp.]|nr:16S rRNA (cytosine(967)-C(5))-methyltransferase RsmB [Candidatus Sulfotelmatobacter sp.]
MAVSPARQAAFSILLRIEREAAYAVEFLHSSLLDDLSPVDKNLTTEIVMGVLRWRSVLDQTIAYLSFTPFRKLDLEVLTALRMGVYQKQFLQKVPPHAAVNETVELVKQARKTSAAGLVNAIMRKVKRGTAPTASSDGSPDSLATALAHPKWLAERWTANFGHEQAKLVCEYDQRVPLTAIRLAHAEDEGDLLREGIQLAPGALMGNARVVTGGDVSATEFFRSGKMAIQDEGSQLVAALVGAGKRILDCCAAPGGKTSALAMRLPEAEIFAAELHPHRARLLRRMAPQTNVHVVTADAAALPFAAEFDRVLADVPCSGTGTLARNPEIKWRLQPGDLHDLQSRQIAILQAAMRHVSPGGRLVYSTCSLEPEENEQIVTVCMQTNSEFRTVPVQEELLRLRQTGELVWEDIQKLVSGNFLRTLPGVHPCDGFFAGILQRIQ